MAWSYPGKFMHRLQFMSFADYTMANIQNYSISEIVTSVPEHGIWRDQKFVRCADAIYKFLIFWVHSRHLNFSQSVDFA